MKSHIAISVCLIHILCWWVACGNARVSTSQYDDGKGLIGGLRGRNLQQPPNGLTEYDCEISLVARDFFTQMPEHDIACRNLQDGQFFPLIPPSKSNIHPETGDRITIRGIGVQGLGVSDTTVVVDSWYNYKPSKHRHLQSAMVGTRSAIMLILRFTDSTSSTGFLGTDMDSTEKRKAVAKQARNAIFKNDDNLSHADAWNQCSYGKLNLRTDSDGLDASGVAGQYAADFPGDSADVYYADVPSVCSQANDPMCDRDYNIAVNCSGKEYYGAPFYALKMLEATIPNFSRSTYQHKVVVLDTSNTACKFVGLGNVGCSASFCYSWVPTKFSGRLQAFTHEMGHNIGLAHAGSGAATSGLDQQYGDHSDAMGYCCTTRCYNGPHAYELGWLSATELTSSSITSSTDYTLNSMSNTDSSSLISIKADWAGGDGSTYWIQLKTAYGYDKFIGNNFLNNVQIKKWNKGGYELTLDQGVKLVAGGSWVDPSGLVVVTVKDLSLSGGNGYASVNIGWMSGPVVSAPTPAPTQGPTPSSANPVLSGDPSPGPTTLPTIIPTASPTQGPTQAPTQAPSQAPTSECDIPCDRSLGSDGFLMHQIFPLIQVCREICVVNKDFAQRLTRKCGPCPLRMRKLPLDRPNLFIRQNHTSIPLDINSNNTPVPLDISNNTTSSQP